jgi:hypothetical protein
MLNAATGLLLLLCAAAVVLWVRGYTVEDTFAVAIPWGIGDQHWVASVASYDGDLELDWCWPVKRRVGHFTRPASDAAVGQLWGYRWGDPATVGTWSRMPGWSSLSLDLCR